VKAKSNLPGVLAAHKKIAQGKTPLVNRWWFEVGRWTDEILWAGADHRWQWWKEAVPQMNPDYRKSIWRDGAERAAFEYELARRSCQKALKLPTYPELTAHEQNFLKSLLGIADARWVAFTNQREHAAQCPHFWNLKETPSAMWKVFKGWLEYERAKRGLPNPKTRPQNKRPIQWKWFDLLDAGVESGDDSGRHTKSEAMKRGRKAFAALKSALSNSEDGNLKRLARVFRASVR
jgi:hypothetical protein